LTLRAKRVGLESAAPAPTASKGPPWHELGGEESVVRTGSSSSRGLTRDEVARRQTLVGPNTLPEEKRRPLLSIFLSQFQSPLIYLLFVAAGVAFFLGERGDAAVILVVLLVNALIGAFQEGRAALAMEALRRMAGLQVRVLRDAREEIVEAREIVPGDILVLAAGDAVAADARLFESAFLEAAEAVLTGESLPVRKMPEALDGGTQLSDRRNMVYAGTHVTAGRGRAVVVGTGSHTEVGKIALLTAATREPRTPLELRLEQFGRYLVVGAVGVFVLVLAAGLLRSLPFTEILMVAISTLVSVVPEGLPVAMTIGLAVGMQRMAARGAIVRRLAAVESLGSTTIICSDKTGTLTRNEMTVTAALLPGGRRIQVTGVGYGPEGALLEAGRELRAAQDAGLAELLEAVALCNDAELVPPDSSDPRWRVLGDPTEAALLTLVRKGGLDPQKLRALRPRSAEIPFDPGARMMATQHGGSGAPGIASRTSKVFLKGAPEQVLELCSSIRTAAGIVPFDESARRQTLAAAEDMASRALRLLAVAVVEGWRLDDRGFESLRGRATFLGLVGQFDPPRPEVAGAVERCHAAGIRPIVITGDHKETGLAVARQLGIARDTDRAVDGRELEEMQDQELQLCLRSIPVFARVHPAQKLRIVENLQATGEVVAMTGDGVNDAPALVRADVGVAMGITGTEVAKRAADIVVTDDNFATIVQAVEEGRVVYRNLKKAILLLLSTALAEIVVLLLALFFGYPLPFAAVQILWNNVVTEGTITVNLMMEPREGDEMQGPPIPRGEPILTRAMLGRMFLMGAVIAGLTLGYFAVRLAQGVPFERARTGTFTLLAVCEWFNVLNCRSATRSAFGAGVLRNRWLVGGILLSNLLQMAVVFAPPLNEVFYTVPLPAAEVLAIGAVGSLVLWVEEARKLVARRRRSHA